MITRFIMTDAAIENYGEEWRDIVLIPTRRANKYMPAKEFYSKGMPKGYHPGYDNSVRGAVLYDLKREDTGEELQMSLYRWELKRI